MKKLLLSLLLLCGLSACGLYTPFPGISSSARDARNGAIVVTRNYTLTYTNNETEDILTVAFTYNESEATDGDGNNDRHLGDQALIQQKIHDYVADGAFGAALVKTVGHYPDGFTEESNDAELDTYENTVLTTTCKQTNANSRKAECTVSFPKGFFPVAHKKYLRLFVSAQAESSGPDSFDKASPKLNLLDALHDGADIDNDRVIDSEEAPGCVGVKKERWTRDWSGNLVPADGVIDGCYIVDPEDRPPPPDADGDGITDDLDNCPEVANPDQANADHAGSGDACETPPAEDDLDGDGVLNHDDNCSTVANSSQTDSDHNGVGDACQTKDDEKGKNDCANKSILGGNAAREDFTACDVSKDEQGGKGGTQKSGSACSLNQNAAQSNSGIFLIFGSALYLYRKRRAS